MATLALRNVQRPHFVRNIVIAVLACVVGLAGLIVASESVGADDQVSVYGDRMGDGFQNWSWATVDLASTAETHGGSAAMAATFGPWEGLYLARPTPMDLPQHGSLEFWVHGGTGTADPISVALLNESREPGASVTVNPTPGKWKRVEIALGEFGSPSRLGGIWWMNGTANARPTIYIDDVRISSGEAPPATSGPSLRVELGQQSVTRRVTDPASGLTTDQVLSFPHAINDEVYGLNFAAPELRDEIRPGVNRWGGNAVERFNYTNGAGNRGSDWYFMSHPGDAGDDNAFENANQAKGTNTLFTIPATGWVTRDGQARCGYPAAAYAPMDDVNGHWLDGSVQCGNGRRNGEVVAGDPQNTSVPVGTDFTTAMVADFVANHGSAAEGGVETYAIGNEPGLWHATHSDIVSEPVDRSSIIDGNIAHAEAVKAADPTAEVVGPVLWGGYSYYVTSAEMAAGQRPASSTASGNVPTFVESYLQAMASAEQQKGSRLIDGLAVNFYDDRVYQGGTDDLRLESTRSLWDPTYAPQDWWVIRDFVGEGHAVIPRMKSLIDANYPGTELAITEYNFGGLDTLAGGLTQADALGIFGREGVDAAMLWDPYNAELSPPIGEFVSKPGMYAYRMFRNYDGQGGAFGDRSLFAESSNQDVLSVYGAERTADGAITVMVINKSTSDQESTLTIPGVSGTAQGYRYGAPEVHTINRLDDKAVDNGLTAVFPARSITLFVIADGTISEPSDPATTDPVTTNPVTTDPAATDPEPTTPVVTSPEPTDPSPTTAPPSTDPVVPPTKPVPVPQPTTQPTTRPTTKPPSGPKPGTECHGDLKVAGALAKQPGPVFCMLSDQPSDTAKRGSNSWVDNFDHDLSMATMTGSSYRVFEPLGDATDGVTWRGGSQKDHWMVDLVPDPQGTTGGSVMRPDQSFRFTDDGTFVVEADYAAAHPDYEQNAWGELIVTTAASTPGYRPGALYGYELFPNHWTLGCRLQPSRVPICALMRDVPGGGTTEEVRAWEISFFQEEGKTNEGGYPPENSTWRACQPGEGDANCRDRFRMELTEDSLTLHVNGKKYFAQTGMPRLPEELLNDDLYVYYGSMFSRHDGETIRYHWDRLAVNPPTGPGQSPTYNS